MIASRTRAVVLLAAAFLVGCAAGTIATTMVRNARRLEWRNGMRASERSSLPPEVQGWLRQNKADTTLQNQLDSVWHFHMAAIDSITHESRVDEVRDSLYATIRPQIEKAWVGVRPKVDSVRQQMRADFRQALPEPMRIQYDSLNARMDSTRKARAEQRNTPGQRGEGGARGPVGPRPGGDQRGGGGPPGGGPPGGRGGEHGQD